MATTSVASGDAVTVKIWLEDLYRDTNKELFFAPWTGKETNNIVQEIRKLDKGPGDQVTITIIPRLTGSFTTGSSGLSMEGREQSITPYTYARILEEYKLAARWKEGLDLQRPIYDMPDECRALLLQNLAENIDALHFDALVSGLTRILGGNGTMYTASATAATALAAGNKITPEIVRRLKTIAQTGGAVAAASDAAPARVFIPPRPVRYKGNNHYILLVHPNVRYDLGENSEYVQELKDARERSPDNPLFSGNAFAMIDGVVVVAHENMPLRSDGGAGGNVVYSKCVLMGAQALIKLYGSYRSKGKLTGDATAVVGKSFGYDEEEGICTKTIMRVGAPSFNSERYGSVGLWVSTTNIAAV